MTKTILITGATAGFGKATAEHFAAAGWNCIITGRRSDRLAELATELKNNFAVKIHTLCFDVQDREAVFTAINSLPIEWQSIDVLLNNAGLALGRDSFELANLDDWDTMINTNVKGLMYVSKAVLPLMIAKKKGHIINIGSTAGKEVYKDGNGYCASKHAVDAISKAMRIDLLPHQIKVTAIHPGAAETEFSLVRFKGDDQKANVVYDGYKALEAKDIAEIVYYVSTLPAHVCINDLVVTCLSQANSFYLHK
ncbi:MAG TPA: SDR family NAD(P)-dependent oxidoreductase [Sediminibacterium sp.]|uniref:SDR family NAD(P)-dependent oxidoreductase n=1 Tax=Sediminibacterium sp. TaxID=1917865 RepID=UPI0008BEE8FF|nr:SDR family NAD(P)-dependent oxidoreductase [Sediminibacterium sp.]OHC86922.1 MAG: NAD(P)-dependent oxidoreductase [Sphingobacteriia bacterium RIFOXYC2_FULL_35_18]OHC88221.1 MAG: NAD(P)-dependent oxidoreductase [Sphingobacteriia bacterium RIFOXYD2_FULL_35_12]HLD51691.1 SDR family NAD(P)-dependent oxidoreductase [Sediminibacterium sp.]